MLGSPLPTPLGQCPSCRGEPGQGRPLTQARECSPQPAHLRPSRQASAWAQMGSHREGLTAGRSAKDPAAGRDGSHPPAWAPVAGRRGVPREPSSRVGREVPPPCRHVTGVSLSFSDPPSRPANIPESGVSPGKQTRGALGLSQGADSLGINWALTPWGFPELPAVPTPGRDGACRDICQAE